MKVYERQIRIAKPKHQTSLISYLERELKANLKQQEIPIRFVVTHTDDAYFYCELGLLEKENFSTKTEISSLFSFHKRTLSTHNQFNAVMLIPTGIGAEIGGHAGDACPSVKLLANVCDNLITHPNAVNASDINEMPKNGLYVEGSTLCRLLMGEIGLNPVRSNRVLFVLDDHFNTFYVNNVINSLNAARATYGLNCPLIVKLKPSFQTTLEISPFGRASGKLTKLENLISALDAYKGQYDAIALASIIDYDEILTKQYFESDGSMLNPWGGSEALLTHSVSLLYNLPSAHSPMNVSNALIAHCQTIQNTVDPRMAAEFISMTFLQCIFKGLQNSPQIITNKNDFCLPSVISAKDISCLVIPDHCLGLPVLAALEQGIPVIAVKENKNIMKNDLRQLNWKKGQYYEAENYLEAAGIMNALKAGIALETVRRPLEKTPVVTHYAEKENDDLEAKMLNISCEGCKSHCCGQMPGVTPVLLPNEVVKFSEYADDRDGIYTLKKKPDTGTCVFLDDSVNRCTIYEHRPCECRLFPIVLNFESDTPFKIDNRCPHIAKMSIDKGSVAQFIKKHEFPKEWVEKFNQLVDC